MNKNLLENLDYGVIHVNEKGDLLFTNQLAIKLLELDPESICQKKILSIIPDSNIISLIKSGNPKIKINKFKKTISVVEISGSDHKTGIILLFNENEYKFLEKYLKDLKRSKYDLESLMNLSGELVTITDGKGTILRVSAKCEEIMGLKEKEFLGSSVYELERKGFLTSSSTVQVLKTKRMCEITQVTKSGKRLFVRGYPIFNSKGHIVKVINLSKDITEEYNLKRSLLETKELADYYQNELLKIEEKDQGFIMKSKSMKEIYDFVSRISDVDATALLLGESGVGKDVVARMIHKLSNRKENAFIKINCGAIPENLIESELFGYSKGTFTGGNEGGKQGLIMAANGGTLFLDEIGDLPHNLQVKLLQVLQEKQITRLGETVPVKVDVRIITATNHDLESMVKEKKFRKDLYYRLNVIPIKIPPLRERKDDIPFLIDYFLRKYNKKYNNYKSIDEKVINIFTEDQWEGNVRELENTIERLIVTVPDDLIELRHLPKNKLNNKPGGALEGETLKELMNSYEKEILLKAIENSVSMKEISEKLGVNISTISRKLKKHNISIAKMQN